MGKRNLPSLGAARRAYDKRKVRELKDTGASRSCGTCSACCTAKGVRELEKKAGVACTHVVEGSKACSIYDERPASCREYSCLWKLGAFDGFDRPDRLGVVMEMGPGLGPVHDTGVFVAREAFPGGFQAADLFLYKLSQKCVVILVNENRTRRVIGPPHLLAAFQQKIASLETAVARRFLPVVSGYVEEEDFNQALDRKFALLEEEANADRG